MKKSAFVLLLLLLCQTSVCQEFSFIMTFEDAIGNTDTISIGYDPTGTVSMDTMFDEVNIIDAPWDSIFEVRITNALYASGSSNAPPFESKTQIIDKECLRFPNIKIEVDIMALNWPVTASWNPNLFIDICNEGSVFTSILPGGWWDTGSPSDLGRINLKQTNFVQFSPQQYEDGFNANYAYQVDGDVIISGFWIGFGPKELSVATSNLILSNSITLYPNPSTGSITVRLPKYFETSDISIYNHNGQVLFETKETVLSLESQQRGIYFLRIQSKSNEVIWKKFVKL